MYKFILRSLVHTQNNGTTKPKVTPSRYTKKNSHPLNTFPWAFKPYTLTGHQLNLQ